MKKKEISREALFSSNLTQRQTNIKPEAFSNEILEKVDLISILNEHLMKVADLYVDGGEATVHLRTVEDKDGRPCFIQVNIDQVKFFG